MHGEQEDTARDAHAPQARPLTHRWSVTAVLLVGYAGLRALNIWELWAAATSQEASGPANPLGTHHDYFVHSATPASPALSSVLANWDGQWYERIAEDGYPSAAEARSDNDRWAWAFPPLFPMLARLVMVVTGLDFPVAVVALNLVLGAVATVLLYGLFRHSIRPRLAMAGALSLSMFMSAPLFALAYSEPAALVFLLVAIRATVTRRYWLALAAVLLLAFTRPVAAPLAVVFAAHWWLLWRRRRTSRISVGTHATLAACALAAVVSPFLWNLVAASLFGSPTSSTSGSTNQDLSGVSRTSWMVSAFDFGWFGAVNRLFGVGGVVVLLLMVASALGISVWAATRLGLPAELRVWGVAYVLFVVLVTPMTPGLIRYLLLAAPLLVAIHVLPLTWRNRAAGLVAFAVVAGIGLWTQWLWIRYLYILDPAPALLPWPP